MGYLADIYVIQITRSKQRIDDFLNHFLPNRTESAVDYWLPEYADVPTHEFNNADDLMRFLEINDHFSSRIYWNNTDEQHLNKHAMIFYNEDGSTIFGISRNADMSGNLNTENEDQCLAEMKSYFGTHLGYIHYENPPADSFEAFVAIVNQLKNESR